MESGWGNSVVGDHNYGNLHAGDSWTGKTKRGWDKDKNGRRYETDFRSYNDSTEYARDKWDRATKLYGLDADDTFDEFMDKLLGGNPNKYQYAEDPEYREKVKDMIYSVNKRIDLNKLEEERQAQ
jgi:flagellum-specific peptidoglycan hydrolase FlgJ